MTAPTSTGPRRLRPVIRSTEGRREGDSMRVLCAWCLKENKPEPEALIGEREPFEDQEDSHGICPDHRREFEQRVTRLREELRQHKEMVPEPAGPWPKSSTLLQRI